MVSYFLIQEVLYGWRKEVKNLRQIPKVHEKNSLEIFTQLIEIEFINHEKPLLGGFSKWKYLVILRKWNDLCLHNSINLP